MLSHHRGRSGGLGLLGAGVGRVVRAALDTCDPPWGLEQGRTRPAGDVSVPLGAGPRQVAASRGKARWQHF